MKENRKKQTGEHLEEMDKKQSAKLLKSDISLKKTVNGIYTMKRKFLNRKLKSKVIHINSTLKYCKNLKGRIQTQMQPTPGRMNIYFMNGDRNNMFG